MCQKQHRGGDQSGDSNRRNAIQVNVKPCFQLPQFLPPLVFDDKRCEPAANDQQQKSYDDQL